MGFKSEDIDELFKYHSPSGDQPERYNAVRAKARELAKVIVDCTPESADQTAAVRKLRECVMTANASIALGPASMFDFAEPPPVAEVHIGDVLLPLSVAAICHDANAAYCRRIGDESQVAWVDAPEWQKKSALTGVEFVLANPEAPASANHDSWLAEKERDGWKYGAVKNPETKEHPCFVPYEALPPEQQAKDYLFKGIVESLRPFIAAGETADLAAKASV